jgi:hypothetical protein
MSTFTLIKAKVHVQKQITYCVSGDVLSLFHEVSIMIQAFLPTLDALLEYASVKEVHC